MKKRALPMRSTLVYAFGLLSLLVLVLSALATSELNSSNERFRAYVEETALRTELVSAIRASVDERAIAARDLVLAQSADDVPAEHAEVLRSHEKVQSALAQLRAIVGEQRDDGGQASALVERIATVEKEYGPVAIDIVNDAMNNRRELATSKINVRCRPLLAQLISATDAYAKYAHAAGERSVAQARSDYARQRSSLGAFIIATVAFAAAAALLILKKVLRTLGAEPFELSEITKRISEGDLSRIARGRKAPMGSVLASMSTMQKSLAELIGQARSSVENIAAGTREIAAGNADLSSRTEQQAASLQATALNMEELTATVSRNADIANRVSGLAQEASAVAERGSRVVGHVADTMTEISNSSNRIADITGIIEGIAFQTNILALNAAVEAARAGAQGRGFAVVASEVRLLAQRSSTAAKEIKALIGASAQMVGTGTAMAAQAGETMIEVTHAVARVTGMMEQIAAASAEQSRGIQAVNVSIAQMDVATQQNAALVQQVAAASQALEDQGRMLSSSVGVFRCEDAA